jgi:hemoglobin/transferrin/lactoferrin receptor protein
MKKFITIIIVSAFAYNTQAQSKRMQDSIATKQLNEVVISGSKNPTLKTNIVQPIQIIDAKALQQNAGSSLADVLQNSGTVYMQKSQAGGGSPIIRGFEANKVLMVIDGVRMNNAIYRGGHLQNVITVDQNILERVEVLNGSASTLYGSDALGGVIVMQSKMPKLYANSSSLKSSGNVMLKYANANTDKTLHIDFNLGNNKLASLTSFTFSDFGDLKSGSNRTTNYGDWGLCKYYATRINNADTMMANSDVYVQKRTGYSQIDVMQKIQYQQNANISHLVNVQYSRSSNINRYDRLSEYSSNGKLTWADWYYGPQARLLASYQFKYQNNYSYINTVNVTIAHQAIQESRNQRKLNSDNFDQRTENLSVTSFDINATKNIKKQKVTMGLDAQFNTLKSVGVRNNIKTKIASAINARYPNGKNSMQYINVYAQHIGTFFRKKMILNDGIRFSTIALNSTITDNSFLNLPYTNIGQKANALTFQLGVAYKLTNEISAYYQYNTGFRVANIDDAVKIFETTNNTLIVPNATLQPEKSHNNEIGIRLTNGKIQAELCVYQTNLSNAMVLDKYNLNGQDSVNYLGTNTAVYAMQNKASALIRGMQANLRYKMNPFLSAYGNLTFTNGTYTNAGISENLDHIPPTYGQVGLSYLKNKLCTELNTQFNNVKPLSKYRLNTEDNEAYATVIGMPSWYKLNLKTNYTINNYLQVALNVDNIMDTHYRTFGSGISAAGRNVSIVLRARF